METSCCGPQTCGPRNFPTREEKIAKLSEYKKALEQETQGVNERINELKQEE